MGENFENLIISQPPVNKLPLFQVDFRYLPRYFSVEQAIKIINIIMLEHSILFITKDVECITPIIEFMLTLMFPFEHQMIYIPILSENMLEFLSSPVPFIAGVHSSLEAVAVENIYPTNCIVNIDKSTILFKSEKEGEFGDILKDMESLSDNDTKKLIDKTETQWYFINMKIGIN